MAVLETNKTYENSGIRQRLILAHTAAVEYPESGDLKLNRDRLQHPSDGSMDDIHTLRNDHAADLVSLWTESGDCCRMPTSWKRSSRTSSPWDFPSCDATVLLRTTALPMNWAITWGRATIASIRQDGSPYIYNHGYVNVTGGWRTIMAYNKECEDNGTSCTRLPYWSNPNITYNGAPMGVAESVDNSRTLNNTAASRSPLPALRASTSAPASRRRRGRAGGLLPLRGRRFQHFPVV